MATHSSVPAWESQGRESLVCCCLWGRTESDMTEATWQQQLVFHLSLSIGNLVHLQTLRVTRRKLTIEGKKNHYHRC